MSKVFYMPRIQNLTDCVLFQRKKEVVKRKVDSSKQSTQYTMINIVRIF